MNRTLCHTACTDVNTVSAQHIALNTSLAVYLTNVPTRENSASILFFLVLVEASFSRLAWVRRKFHVVETVLTRTPVFRVTVCILLDPAEPLVSLVCPLVGQQRWNLLNMREHLNDSQHLWIFSPLYFACLSQCLERYREDQHVPAQILTPINREM